VSKAVGKAPALPGVAAELDQIFLTRPDDKAGVIEGSVRLDEAFAESSLSATELHSYRLIHLATHFSLDPRSATRSVLLLGDGTFLSLSTIDSWPPFLAGIDLLALSACETALGSLRGCDVEALAIVAQRKGAKAVLASLWPVGDASTALLMTEFYRGREHDGTSKIAALRRAQLGLLSGKLTRLDAASHGDRKLELSQSNSSGARQQPDQNYSHPYYWAPFILIGNWR
jgi:CHAT domain-containing protein